MLYKQTQARLVRSVGLACWTGLGAYLAHEVYANFSNATQDKLLSTPNLAALGVLLAFMVSGFYAMYMHPKTSEFLIEVDAEANKVSWPQWLTVKQSTGQVIIVMIFFMFFLFCVDYVFTKLFEVVL